MLDELIEVSYPPQGQPLAGMISIPHAGLTMPEEFHCWLTQDQWAWGQDVDFGVHDLIDQKALCQKGVVILKANVHRVACDLNRRPSKAILNWKDNSLGVPLVTSFPSASHVERAISTYHAPYFDLIKEILTTSDKKESFSFVDLHSMPSVPTAYHLAKNPNQQAHRPDFCLSDREGKSCSAEYMNAVKQGLAKYGHHCLVNDPYVGGYVTEFASPYVENNIQIEIKRGLYMDEKKRCLTHKASLLREQLTLFFLELF